MNPIQNKDLEEKILNKLNLVLDEYSSFLSENAVNVLTKKINRLNVPTNIDKLTQSFRVLGITLNEHDVKTISYRNKFLHGSTPIRNFEKNEKKTKKLRLISGKLHLLTNLLLLKYLGYSGHVNNYYGRAVHADTKKMDEFFFRFLV